MIHLLHVFIETCFRQSFTVLLDWIEESNMSHLWHLLLLSLLLWAVHPLLTCSEKSIYVAKNYPIFITSYFLSNLILISYLYGMMVQILTSRTGYYIYAYSFDLQTQNISFSAAQRCIRCETNQARILGIEDSCPNLGEDWNL